ncbi:MAG: sugar ABC transporter permease [Deltaproteobacteria bacterium]|nr:MAG: sugar ABC transporter permease [Deltaproteobacteria bacterium]
MSVDAGPAIQFGPRAPLYARISDALAAALVVGIVAGSVLGLTRYNDARDHRRAVETQVGAIADDLAQRVASAGPGAVEQVPDNVAAAYVVTSGGVDDFGIAVGSDVAAQNVRDKGVVNADAGIVKQGLLNRSAELQDYFDKKQEIPKDRRYSVVKLSDTDNAFSATAQVVKDGKYDGMVHVVTRVPNPAPSTPTSQLLLMLLLSVILGFAASYVPGIKRRVAHGLAVAIPTGLTFMAQADAALVLWPGVVSLVLGGVAISGIASVFRGVREQPRTYVYVVPAMIGMIVLVFVPFAMGVAIAFFSKDGDFTGLGNFQEILNPSATTHPNFYWTTSVTILWTVLNVLLHVSLGVALALVLNRPKLRLKAMYRVLLIIPWAVPNYITALIWKSMFNQQYGAVNSLLDVLGIDQVNWIGPGSSFASNFIADLTTNTWLGFPFMMVVTLGALQSIPKELYEAADIDGAGRWQRFRTVTLPLLKPALIPAIILGVVWTFNMFNVIYLVSGGAPENETNILITEAYYAFKVLNRFGLAAAYSLLIFVMLLLYGWMQNRITRATEGAFE